MDLLRISDLQRGKIEEIYRYAAEYKNGKQSDILKNKNILTIFPQSSLRTRLTFESAVNDLSGRIYSFDLDILEKSEALEDVVRYLNNWVDLMIIRYPDIKKLEEIQEYTSFPIINAMTRENERYHTSG
jgi:ornithine carbamoyltransferase